MNPERKPQRVIRQPEPPNLETRHKEEEQVRAIEQRIDQWARRFFEILERESDAQGMHTPEWYEETVDELIDTFSTELIQARRDVFYVVSRAFRVFGKLNDAWDTQHADQSHTLCFRENTDQLYDIIMRATRFRGNRERILDAQPVFYREDEGALQDIQMTDEVIQQMPQRFFEHPTKFIERLALIERDASWLPTDIESVAGYPYDPTKIKKYKKLVFNEST